MLLWCLTTLVFGIAVLVALGLLIARRMKAARMLFAAGLLATSVIAALATLTYFDSGSEPNTFLMVAALAFLMAGAGQFIAAFRSSWTYAAVLRCAAISQLLLWVAFDAGSGRLQNVLGVLNMRLLEHRLTVAVAGLLPAAASVFIAVFRLSGSRHAE